MAGSTPEIRLSTRLISIKNPRLLPHADLKKAKQRKTDNSVPKSAFFALCSVNAQPDKALTH